MVDEQLAEQLMEQAFGLLEEGETRDALRVARQLKLMPHTSYFEILALACGRRGRFDRAVRVLEIAVTRAPQVWLLWQLLGNYNSDMGRFDEACDAYRRGLECPEAWSSPLHLNYAIALKRQGRYADAGEQLTRVMDEDLAVQREVTRAGLLNDTGQHGKALGLAESLIENLDPEDDSLEPEFLAQLHVECGRAFIAGHGDREAARRCVREALETHWGHDQALFLARELEGAAAADQPCWRLIVEGEWPWEVDEEEGPFGYFLTAQVSAADTARALEYLRVLAPEPVGLTMRIGESETLEECPGEHSGVYWVSDFMVFPLDGE